MILPLFEDLVMRTITISDGKKINVKLNITNQEGCSRGSSTTRTTKAKHGPRVKYIDKNNKQGIPIQVRIKTGDIFFGADSSCKIRTPKEETSYKSKEAKFAVKFVEENFKKGIEIIKSMGNEKYIIDVKES